MSEMKVKVIIGPFNVELEGPSEDVIEQFKDIKEKGLGELVNQLMPLVPKANSLDESKQIIIPSPDSLLVSETEMDSNTDEMSLQNVVIKNLPTSEKEWIAVYGYYLTKNGNTFFTRDQIIKMYDDSKRKSKQRIKNLSGSIQGAVKKGWINAVNSNDFTLDPRGKDYVKSILDRTSGAIKIPRKKPEKKSTDKSE